MDSDGIQWGDTKEVPRRHPAGGAADRWPLRCISRRDSIDLRDLDFLFQRSSANNKVCVVLCKSSVSHLCCATLIAPEGCEATGDRRKEQ